MASSFSGLLLLAGGSGASPIRSGDDYDYTINSGNTNTITITEYTGPDGAVTIPTNINNLTGHRHWEW